MSPRCLVAGLGAATLAGKTSPVLAQGTCLVSDVAAAAAAAVAAAGGEVGTGHNTQHMYVIDHGARSG